MSDMITHGRLREGSMDLARGFMSGLTLVGVTIRQDDEGRFCLNDFHRASGGDKRHQSSNWLRLQQTRELVREVEKSLPQIRGIRAKTRVGTFAVEDLVISYAAWISPKFHAYVLRTFKSAVVGRSVVPTVAPGSDPSGAAEMSLDVMFLAATASMFKLKDSAKALGMLAIGKKYGVETSCVPTRSIEGPTDADADSSWMTHSATELIKRRGIDLYASEMHLLLLDEGLVRVETRISTNRKYKKRGGHKPFYVIIGEGHRYGKNYTSAHCQTEPKPTWYDERFDELLDRVSDAFRRRFPSNSSARKRRHKSTNAAYAAEYRVKRLSGQMPGSSDDGPF
jgi:KilA-N domain